MWSHVSQMIRRIKQIWAELDYAQRRLLEIRTGVPMTPRGARAHARAEAHELEALYDREHPDEHPDERSAPALVPAAHS